MSTLLPEANEAVRIMHDENRCYWCGERPELLSYIDIIGITGDMPFPYFDGGERRQAEYNSEDGKYHVPGAYGQLCERCTKLNDHLWEGVSRSPVR